MKYSEKIPQFMKGWEEATNTHTPSTGKLKNRITVEYARRQESDIVIISNHYLKRSRPFSTLAYWIMLDGRRIGVVQYALPRLNPATYYHGEHVLTMLELSRMWIDPAVQGGKTESSDGEIHCNSIASCAIAKTLKTVRLDWAGRYPASEIMRSVVSWADDVHHEGTIYRAANFTEYSKAGGVFPGPKKGIGQILHEDYLHIKSTFIYRFKKPLQQKQVDKARLAWQYKRSDWYNRFLEKQAKQPEQKPDYQLTPLF